MKSISETALKKATTLHNTLLIGALWLVMAFFVMPEAMRQNSIYTNGAEKISVSIRHSPAKFFSIARQYGEKGRQHFIAIELTAGVFYAIVTSLLLGFFMLWSFYFSKNKYLKTGYLLRLAFFVLTAFLLENMGTAAMLLAYPSTNQGLYYLTAIFSILKMAAVVTSLAVIVWNVLIYPTRKPKCAISPEKENPIARGH